MVSLPYKRNREVGLKVRLIEARESLRKNGNGKMVVIWGKWENGEMGKWGNGEMEK